MVAFHLLSRRLLPFLLLPQLILAHGNTDGPVPLTTRGPHECARHRAMFRSSYSIDNKTVKALTVETARSTGQLFRVFGMTVNCYIYYGWLHSVYSDERDLRGQNLPDFGMNCERKDIMLMKSEGISMDILVVMDRVGNRVRIQSATSGNFYADTGDLVWLNLSKDRKEHTFTDPVDKGYVIESFIDVNSRAFVVARNHHRVRLYELRLFVDNEHNLIAYLRDEVMDIDPMLVSPLKGLVGRLVYDLNSVRKAGKKKTKSGKREKQIPKGHNEASGTNETNETNMMGVKKRTKGNKVHKVDQGLDQCGRAKKETARTSGLVFLPGDQLYADGIVPVLAIPISSLLVHSYRGIDPSHPFSNFLFMERQSRFFVYRHSDCNDIMRSAASYPRDLPLRNNLNKNEDGTDDYTNCSFRIPSALESGYGITTRKWFNAAQFHRRMSSPHSTLTNRPRNIRAGWIVVAPVLFGTVAAILAASIILSISFSLWEKRSRRLAALSATSTYSVRETW